MIMKAQEDIYIWSQVEEILNELKSIHILNDDDMRKLLMQKAVKSADNKVA
jgi:hypothetical protein